MSEENLLDPEKPYGPLNVGDLEIIVDREGCIGASACIPPADKTFTLNDEGKAVILATASEDSEDDIIDAARACPVLAIKIRKNGKDLI